MSGLDVLLVDDELDVVEGIADGVDFAALGLEEVYVAQTSQRAKELLQSRDIGVMVTDIEMPGGSGLELLEWVRDNQMEVVTLFCTGFANFNYAQKAVELHSFDYFLKPIAYPALQERLAAAVEEARRLRSLASVRRNLPGLQLEQKRNYWLRLLTGGSPAPAEEDAAHYGEDGAFALCACSLADGSEAVGNWKRYAMRNVLDELAGEEKMSLEAIVPLWDGAQCAVFSGVRPGALDRALRRLEAFIKDYLSCWGNFYYVTGIALEDAPQAFARVKDCLADDVCSQGVVCRAGDYVKRSIPYTSGPRVQEWSTLLTAGRIQELEEDICAHLDRLSAREQVNMPYIKAMRIDLMQMVHTVLGQRQIQAHALFSDRRFDTLRERSLFSISHMKRYLCYVVRTAGDYMEYMKESHSAVGKMKEYINAHYQEDVTRGVLAKVFFLNPDYLARVFKKETGLSIGGYLQDIRMNEAKKLLAHTNVPVNEVAMGVGYDNISYFSHVFREKTGLTPVEYRRRGGG